MGFFLTIIFITIINFKLYRKHKNHKIYVVNLIIDYLVNMKDNKYSSFVSTYLGYKIHLYLWQGNTHLWLSQLVTLFLKTCGH